MSRVFIISIFVISIFLGCKSSKNISKYNSPHTDTLKIAVNYQADSVELFVKKIIESDSLFNLKKRAMGYSLVGAKQKDSILYLTIKSYNGCTKMDFDLYQNSFVFKSYPPRLRMRLAKTNEKKCNSENEGRVTLFTAAFDIRAIVNEYKKVHLIFAGTGVVTTLKK